MKKSNLLPIIDDFFDNNEILVEDKDDIVECISIIAEECKLKYTKEELIILVEKKIKIIPPTYTSKDIKALEHQIAELKKIKQPEQRTEEWYEFRRNRLTASDLATAMGSNVYASRNKLIASKCGYREDFKPGAAILHGVKFEPMATLFYEKLYNLVIYEYGCVPHPTIEYFAASPDGIVDPSSVNKKYIGRMLEIKCPKSRELNGFVPEYYELQIQGQLEVCDLEYCDFLECKFKEYTTMELLMENRNQDSNEWGVIIASYNKELDKKIDIILPRLNMSIDEVIHWIDLEQDKIIADDNLEYVGIYFWELDVYSCILIKRDKELFQKIRPRIIDFWKFVEYHREHGIEDIKSTPKNKTTKNKNDIPSGFICSLDD